MDRNQSTYIKMCIKASKEIRKYWEKLPGDFYLDISEEKPVVKLIKEKGEMVPKNAVWLPLQHQLQKVATKYGYLAWFKYDDRCSDFWLYFTKRFNEHPSKEMCGLAVIMHAAQLVYWLGEDWEKAE